jgi:hypothetical protein
MNWAKVGLAWFIFAPLAGDQAAHNEMPSSLGCLLLASCF